MLNLDTDKMISDNLTTSYWDCFAYEANGCIDINPLSLMHHVIGGVGLYAHIYATGDIFKGPYSQNFKKLVVLRK